MTHAELTAITYFCCVGVVAFTVWACWSALRLFCRVVRPTTRQYRDHRKTYRYLMAHPDELQKVRIARTGIYPVRSGTVVGGVVGGIIGYELGHHNQSSMDDPGEEDIPW